MSDEPDDLNVAVTARWAATCKDCRTRRGLGREEGKARRTKPALEREKFDYSDEWATRTLERGGSRSDRCPECRRTHAQEIRAFPVAYVDIKAIGQAVVADPSAGPTGPLGGLGPLPARHDRTAEPVTLTDFKLGLNGGDILELIERMAEHQVVILEAATGTGKSTLAPFRLMNPPKGARYRPTDFGPIIVTEPRIPATTEVAKFVGEAMCFGHDPAKCTQHIGPGYPVGYQCDGKKVWDDACRLIYVTDGSMINWIRNGDLARFSTVIIDEAHERSENIDTILALLHQYLPRYPNLKVIIASATIDRTLFEEYFSDVATVGHYSVEAVKTIGYGVPLFAGPTFPGGDDRDGVLKDGLTIVNPADPGGEPLIAFKGWNTKRTVETDNRDLRKETAALLDLRWEEEIDPARWLREMPKACATQAFRIIESVMEKAVPPGDVLVFLPTETSVLDSKAFFERKLEGQKWPVSAHWLMKATPDNEKDRALAECKPGSYKVVFASNLAETSLTIAGLRYVVDSGLICQTEWDPVIAASSFPVGMHSQSGVRQRWGRVGRKTYGWVFPLYTIEQFSRMPRDTPAGSTQTSLEQTYMKLAAAGVDDISTVKLPANFTSDKVNRDSFAAASAENFSVESARARKALVANGAMTADGHLTSLGRELERSRLSTERTMALLFADRLACVPEVSLALVALDAGRLVGPDRLLQDNWRWAAAWCVNANRCHRALALGCSDDLDLVLRIFSDWETAPDPSAWARTWWVNEEALVTIREQVAGLIDDMAPGMSKEASRPFDLRLTGRVRAVLSRSLTSAHYQRRADGLYEAVDAVAEAGPVSLDEHRLVEPAETVVALHRERPRILRGSPAEALPLIRGIVNVSAWACRGIGEAEGPEPFELMLRARRELRRDDGELIAPSDPLRPLRAAFPVGAVMAARLRQDGSGEKAGPKRWARFVRAAGDGTDTPRGLLLDGARLVRAPFSLPGDLPARPEDRVVEDKRLPRSAKQVYTGSGVQGRETSGDFRRRTEHLAGTEEAPEEVALRPRSIIELETERLGGVSVAVEAYVPDAVLDDADRVTSRISVRPYGPVGLPVGSEFVGAVIGYALEGTDAGLRLEAIHDSVFDRKDPAEHDDLSIGDEVDVLVGELVQSFSGSYRVLHHCDEHGKATGRGDFYFCGPCIDEYDDRGAESLNEDSVWTAKVLPWGRPFERQPISLIGQMYDLVITEYGLRADSGSQLQVGVPVIGSLVGGPILIDDRICRLVKLDAPNDLGFAPRFVVPFRSVTAAPAVEDELPPGTAVGLRIEPKLRARREGRWSSDQLDKLEKTRPGLIDVKGETFHLATNAALDDAGVHALLRLAPGDPSAEQRVWRLWATSRHLGVAGGNAGRLVHGADEIEALQAVHAATVAAKRQNVAAKDALVGAARQLADSTDWIEAADGFRSLMGRWKEVGPVPRDVGDRLWEEFISARRHFDERLATQLEASPTAILDLGDRARRLFWPEQKGSAVKHIDRLRRLPGILQVETARATLTVAGSHEAICSLIDQVTSIVSGVEGRVELSDATYVGRVIGTGGGRLREMKESSGVSWVRTPERGSTDAVIMVGGPSRRELEWFLQAIEEIDELAQLEVTSEPRLVIIDRETGKNWSRTKRKQLPERTHRDVGEVDRLGVRDSGDDDSTQAAAVVAEPEPPARTVRVHELAMELGISSRRVLEVCARLRIVATTPSSGLAADQADRVRREVDRLGVRDSGDDDSTQAAAVVAEPEPPARTVRVHELAKYLGISSRRVLEVCARLRIAATTPSSGVAWDQAERVRREVDRMEVRDSGDDDSLDGVNDLINESGRRVQRRPAVVWSRLDDARRHLAPVVHERQALVYGLGADGGVMACWDEGGRWTGWSTVGGGPMATIAAARHESISILFGLGRDRRVHACWEEGGYWRWSELGGATMKGIVSATHGKTAVVYGVATGGGVHVAWPGSKGWRWVDLGGEGLAEIAAVGHGDEAALYGVDHDRQVQVRRTEEGRWSKWTALGYL
jgi:HrpA-like RNA helicase